MLLTAIGPIMGFILILALFIPLQIILNLLTVGTICFFHKNLKTSWKLQFRNLFILCLIGTFILAYIYTQEPLGISLRIEFQLHNGNFVNLSPFTFPFVWLLISITYLYNPKKLHHSRVVKED